MRRLLSAALALLLLWTPALAANVTLVGADQQTQQGTAANPLYVSQSAQVGDCAETAQTGTLSGAGALVTLNTQGCSYIAFQFTSIGSGNSILVESSNDGTAGTGTTFALVPIVNTTSTSSPLAVAAIGPGTSALYFAATSGPTTRIRVSSYSSGTVTVIATPKRGAMPLANNQIVGGNVNSGTADAGSPVKMGCKYNVAVQGFATGNRTDCQAAPTGAIYTEEGGRPFSNITTNATTTVKSGAGFLHAICINTKGASANVATVYDNTAGSGTKIGTLDTTAQVGCLTYDAAFATGLTVVTATGTAADLTVTYR